MKQQLPIAYRAPNFRAFSNRTGIYNEAYHKLSPLFGEDKKAHRKVQTSAKQSTPAAKNITKPMSR